MSVPQEIVEAMMARALEECYDWGVKLSEDEEQELYIGIVNTLELVGPMFEAHALEKAADLAEKEDVENGWGNLRNLAMDFDGNPFPIQITPKWLREVADNIRCKEGE